MTEAIFEPNTYLERPADADKRIEAVRDAIIGLRNRPSYFTDESKKIRRFCGALEDKYSRAVCGKTELYNILIGASGITGITQFDFPGEDSVEKFVSSL